MALWGLVLRGVVERRGEEELGGKAGGEERRSGESEGAGEGEEEEGGGLNLVPLDATVEGAVVELVEI